MTTNRPDKEKRKEQIMIALRTDEYLAKGNEIYYCKQNESALIEKKINFRLPQK